MNKISKKHIIFHSIAPNPQNRIEGSLNYFQQNLDDPDGKNARYTYLDP
jgi:hypothetical protein